MNKEQLRKELEDCWDAAQKYFDWQKREPRYLSYEPPYRDNYITTRLAALDDGDGEKSVKVQLEFYHSLKNIHICNGKLNIRYGTLLCSMCAPGTGINLLIEENKIEEFKRWAEPVDDGQEGKGLDDIRAWLKSQIEWLIAAKNSDEKVFNDDELDGMSIAYKAMQDKLEALPVADGEGEKAWPPGLRWKKGNEFVITEKELSAFMAEVYTETEWYPDYVAKGEAEESAQTRKDFLRGWKAAIISSLPSAVTGVVKWDGNNRCLRKQKGGEQCSELCEGCFQLFKDESEGQPAQWNQQTIKSCSDEVLVQYAMEDYRLRINADLSKEVDEEQIGNLEKTRDDVKRLLMNFTHPDNET